jgi:hypothetical protein
MTSKAHRLHESDGLTSAVFVCVWCVRVYAYMWVCILIG